MATHQPTKDLPIFTGDEDPLLWTLQIDLYCWEQKIPHEERLGVALMHLEDRALNWVYEWETTEFNWPAFTKALRQEFWYGKKSEATPKISERTEN